jgi:hypothetical protein
MTHDFEAVVGPTPEALIRISHEDFLHAYLTQQNAYCKEIFALRCDERVNILWESYPASSDLFEQGFFVPIEKHEGGLTRQHLVNDAADAPPIDSLTMADSVYNLGCQVFWGTAKGARICIRLYVFL